MPMDKVNDVTTKETSLSRRAMLLLSAILALTVSLPDAVRAHDVVLTISVGDRSFTMTDDDLLALPQYSVETTTQWTDGVLRFGGPSLRDVLDAAGVTEGEIKMYAVNDYSVAIPWSAIGAEIPVVANRLNGAPFSLREKGPLWVVFPYDSGEEYRTEQIFSYSIWQLNRITVE